MLWDMIHRKTIWLLVTIYIDDNLAFGKFSKILNLLNANDIPFWINMNLEINI